MLIAVLAMSLLLCGCRTRISNNTEVASTITDDEGWMQELYQERRDELGIPVAKKPFFTGSPEEEIDGYDDYDSDMDSLDEYEADPWEDEDFDEDDSDEPTSTPPSTSQSTTTPSRKTSSTTVRRRTSTTTTPRRRTSTTTTKKKTTNTSTETTPKQYTVSFDGNGVDMGGATITVDKGGKYGTLPTPPTREEYIFDGWYTEKEGGSKITEGSTYNLTGNQTLYAHWTKKDAKEIWGNRFEIAANEQKDKLDCWIPGTGSSSLDKTAKDVVGSCKGNSVEQAADPKCIIAFVSNDKVTDEEARRLFEENSGTSGGGSEGGDGGEGGEGSTPATPSALEKVIVISDDAIAGSDSQKLFYKLALLDAMHGKVGQDTLDAAGADLGISEYLMAIYTKP